MKKIDLDKRAETTVRNVELRMLNKIRKKKELSKVKRGDTEIQKLNDKKILMSRIFFSNEGIRA
jgi:hypothetical protein